MKCNGCNKEITSSYIKAQNDHFHPDCFVCASCGKVLKGTWMEHENKRYHHHCLDLRCDICGKQMTEGFVRNKDGKYHQQCYLQKKAPRCNICAGAIVGNYIKDIWGNISHPLHMGRKPLACDCCSRFIGPDTSEGGFKYSDGRHICGICQNTAVSSMLQINSILNRVRKKLTDVSSAFTIIPAHVPVKLVDRYSLQRLGKYRTPERGMGFTVSNITKENGKRVKIEHTVYILFGLPRIQFESVLAHELFHVWLNEQDIRISPKESEGFCNLASALIYQADTSELARHLLEKMHQDPDPVYGDGYRKMHKTLQQLGWQRLLKRMR